MTTVALSQSLTVSLTITTMSEAFTDHSYVLSVKPFTGHSLQLPYTSVNLSPTTAQSTGIWHALFEITYRVTIVVLSLSKMAHRHK